MAKKLIRSKQFWLNVLGGAATVVSALSGNVIPSVYASAILAVANVAITAIKKHQEAKNEISNES